MTGWAPDISRATKPRYLAIADSIADDVTRGRLRPSERLPTQRQLATILDIDFTTVARGYAEAQRRGLVEARVGQGTFVTKLPPRPAAAAVHRPEAADLSLNLPPEPTDPSLLLRMRAGLEAIGRDMPSLLRYQTFGGSEADKAAAAAWLGRRALTPRQELIFIVPGAHAALLGIAGSLARPGDVILSEALTYPGIRSVADQLGLTLIGLPLNEEGLSADAFAEACERAAPKALYVNPTLLNPTTHTITAARRAAIVEIARRFRVAIIEDDACGLLPVDAPPSFAALAPEQTWHVATLSKSLGAGLRLAYVVAPDIRSGWTFAAAVRTATVMASPLTTALATQWILDGTADALLAAIRQETSERHKIAAAILPRGSFRGDAAGFHLWMPLARPWTRSAFIGQVRPTGIGIVGSDVFAVDITPPEAVRLCLGGPTDRVSLQNALEFIAHSLAETPARASASL